MNQMPHAEKHLHGVMEDKGSYNRHSFVPQGGGALALPVLEKAVQHVALDGDRPVVIADYGSSQGKNSLAPMRIAIDGFRRRVGPDRHIAVVHIDQPSNDFNTLFEVLSADPASYAREDPNVFPAAIGRSFYESVLPPRSVHLGWSSYAAVWLSRLPALVPDHIVSLPATDPLRTPFEQQGAEDWKAFLSRRALELRPGGRLVVVLPALNDEGVLGFEELLDQVNAALGEMVSSGEISTDERARMIIGAFPRRNRDLLAPFASDRPFHGLTVDEFEMVDVPDAAWGDYERDRDAQALARRHALFFRAVFMPSLASALDAVRSGTAAAVSQFADRLESRLTHRLTGRPTAAHTFVQILVLARN